MTHEHENSDKKATHQNQGPLRDLLTGNQNLRIIGEQSNEATSNELVYNYLSMEQFDVIASKVNEAMKDISSIYKDIGYSHNETTEKKSEIFKTLNNTITSFKDSVQREKSTINNECEWLRQQSRIILSMLNDSKGVRYLNLMSRGIVFDDKNMYANELKKSVSLRMSKCRSLAVPSGRNTLSLEDIPSLSSEISFITGEHSGTSFESEGSSTIFKPPLIGFNEQSFPKYGKGPDLSLLEQRSMLNSVFLDLLKEFVKIFKKFIEVNRLFWENVEVISEDWERENASAFLLSIPSKLEAEEHAALIDEFESALAQLKSTGRTCIPKQTENTGGTQSEEFTFIISSPRKKQVRAMPLENSKEVVMDDMSRLRNINDKLIHAIRGLKLTRIGNEEISRLTRENEAIERMFLTRKANMIEVISECLHLIDILSLSESDLIGIQKIQNSSEPHTDSDSSGEGLLDTDTLLFIQTNPREFGLSKHHLTFITKLADTLREIKETKEKKWVKFSSACKKLWEKLGEDKEYTSRFMEENSKLTDGSLSNFKSELERLHIRKAEYVDTFILDAKKEISRLQAQLLYSPERREEFKYHAYDIYKSIDDKEHVLNEYEVEIGKLKEEYNDKSEILALYASLNELLEDQKFLTESSKDSSRLLSKNSCKILLKEERVRKKICRHLPRVLASLKKEITNYNNRSLSKGERHITVGNDDMLEKVLSIESSLGMQGAKQSRGIVTSPQKAKFTSSTMSSSPIKSSQSPTKISKPTYQRRMPIVARAFSVPQREMNQRCPQNNFGSSPVRRLDSKFKRSLPRMPNSNDTGVSVQYKSTVLKPLVASLSYRSQNTQNLPHSKKPTINRGQSDQTSYSVCSRVSPLRSSPILNRSFSTSFSPLRIPETRYNCIDKENSFNHQKNGRKNVQDSTNTPHENFRLSGGSIANSTIVGEEYQSWRDEQIKLINGEEIDLC